MLITCPECASKISDKALSCPLCGFPMAQQEKPKNKPNRKPRKYPKLPNGFGSIKRLSGNRVRPYGVYPAVKEFNDNGSPIYEPAIAYAKDWYEGFGVLSAYNAGTYEPGQEIEFDSSQITDDFVKELLAAYDYGKSARRSENDMTFTEVYEAYMKWDIEDELSKTEDTIRAKRLGQRKQSMRAAYKNCKTLHNMIFRNLRYQQLQDVVSECPLKHASKELIIVLFHKMYKYANIADIQKEDHSKYVSIKTPDDDEGGVPFTIDELKKIWENRADETLEMVFIMCLSGFRISAYRNMEVNLKENYFKGGVKTENGENRIVPIHSGIMELVKKRMKRDGAILIISPAKFREKMYEALERIGIEKHTPHDCRDTFATLCDKNKVDKIYLKRLIGHSLSSDITEEKYIKPSIETLRNEIEKIDLSLIVSNC